MMTPKDICSICEGEYNEECGGVQGYFGILPVTLCEWCLASTIDMVGHLIEGEEEEDE